MLDVRSVSRHYGDFKAVSEVSFSVDRGEIIGLLGHNGAGKTTIMKMLSGFLEPDSGSIFYHQESIVANPARLQSELGYLPENLPVYPELSVASYLDYIAQLKGLQREQKRTEIRRVVQATELQDKLLSPIANLSRGLKQRVGVAQAIIAKPSLLILDEPTNGLDPGQTEQMRALIRGLSQSATVILSTHIMQEVEAVCDRALIIRSGELAVDARLADLQNSQSIRLSSSAEQAQLQAVLSGVDGVSELLAIAADSAQSTATDQAVTSWLLNLSAGQDIHQTISRCTAALVEAGIAVMGIAPEHRDLQSLFLEVNTVEAAGPERRDGQAAASVGNQQDKENDHVA